MEKTFDELIVEHQWFERSDYAKKEPLLDKIDVLKLLQQVREATIAECSYIELDGFSSVEIQRRFKEIPTDRIKTKL